MLIFEICIEAEIRRLIILNIFESINIYLNLFITNDIEYINSENIGSENFDSEVDIRNVDIDINIEKKLNSIEIVYFLDIFLDIRYRINSCFFCFYCNNWIYIIVL